jgi:hypothetical protein
MRCPNCKNDNPNGFRFCLQCGEDLGAPTVLQRPETVTRVRVPFEDEPLAPPSRSNFWLYSLLAASLAALLIIALLAFGGFLYFSQTGETGEAKQQATPARERATVAPTREPTREPTQQPTQEPTQPRPQQQPARELPTAEPEQSRSTRTVILNQQFQISPRSYFAQNFTVDSPAHLKGSFTSSSPVEVFVTRTDNTMWFQSGRINSGPIDAQLSQGNYTLLFNNRFSWITGKNVRAVAYLQY